MKQQLREQVKALILDMDGVLWKESDAIGDLPQVFNHIQALGLDYVLATNNATKTQAKYVEKLAGFGAQIPEEKIVNSSMAVAYLLRKRFPSGGNVYIVGETGLVEALEHAGFHQAEKDCVAVIASMDRGISFEKLKRATLLIRSGVPFYATNPDRTYPTPEGLIPGAGSLIGSLEISTDVKPIIAGKPNPTLYEFALERLGTLPSQTLVVGDRLETDILGGQNLGCPTALVLSGIATRAEAELHQPPVDVIAESLEELLREWSN
ncbi:MAG TPA: HAD-IIA family hydrolase, partial [Anaerolineaceae bacterium]|nr:HAD-IIA family hydrolase [Anaerolineaceae bacterium]